MKLAELYNKQQSSGDMKKPPQKIPPPKNKQNSNINLVLRMPEIAELIKHLDVLYSSMIVQNMSNRSSGSMWEKVSWFNPGQGSVKQSDSVN